MSLPLIPMNTSSLSSIPGLPGVILIPPLIDASNLPTWDRRLKLSFMYFRLTDFLDGTAKKPGPITRPDGTVDQDAIAKAETKYNEKLILAFALICNSLDKVQDQLFAAGWFDKKIKLQVK